MTRNVASVKQGRSRFRYFGEIISELKKVVWLSRREVAYLTALVLIVTIIFAIILGTVDFGFSNLIDAIFMGK
ncbi:MAG: preprotein translocase subunit SecE [Chloroflexota bacterium]